MTKNILVTGATGFIGSNLMPKLMQKKYRITTLGRQPSSSFPRVNYIKLDLLKEPLPKKELKKIDIIIHLAGNVNINRSVIEPAQALKNNTDILLNLLESCRKNQLKPLIIFASTDRVYGKTKKTVVDEKETAYPIEPYTASKIYDEMLLELYHALYGLPYIILRLDSVYGPGQPRQMFISDIIQKMISQEVIAIGKLNISKNFVYAGDAAEAFISALSAPKSAWNNIYNIGGQNLSLKKILAVLQAEIEKKLNKKISFRFNPDLVRRGGIEVKPFRLNTGKAKKFLHWQPKTSLAKGLSITINYFLKTYGQT